MSTRHLPAGADPDIHGDRLPTGAEIKIGGKFLYLSIRTNGGHMLNFYEHVKANPELLRQFSCRNVLFLINECPPEFKKGEMWAEHNAFVYVISGRHNLYSHDRVWLLQTGSTAFVKKGSVGVERVDDDMYCALMFYVPDEYIRSFTKENAALFPPVDLSLVSEEKVLPVQTSAVMEAFYQSVLPYFSMSEQPPENLIELKFKELLINIISIRNNAELTSYFYKLSMSAAVDLKEVMENNCLFNLQLHEYARLCHRSLSTFKRDFYTLYGTPPGRWLLNKRLEAATVFLKNSDKPVSDVVECGFKNLPHFSKVFKQRFGLSPLQYRKQQSMFTVSS